MTWRAENGDGGDRVTRTEFLVSFLVDARGGTMTAGRQGGRRRHHGQAIY
jgi:hypothetical protein